MDSERECRSQFDSDTVDAVDRGCGCGSLALTLSAPYSVFSTLNLSLPLPPSSVADHHLQPPVHKSRTDTGLSPPDNQWRSRLRVLSELQRLPFRPSQISPQRTFTSPTAAIGHNIRLTNRWIHTIPSQHFGPIISRSTRFSTRSFGWPERSWWRWVPV